MKALTLTIPQDQIANAVVELTRLPQDTFRAVVDEDIRNRAPEQVHEALRTEDLVERWYTCLLLMQTSVEGQLASKSADNRAEVQMFYARRDPEGAMRALAAHEQWRAGSLRFKNGVDQKLIEARSLLRRFGKAATVMEEQRNRAGEVARSLREAIERHRASTSNPTEADLALWAVTDEW
jgi:hypothetical protein